MGNDLKKIGNQTIKLNSKPKIISTYSIVGPKEGQGPLGQYFHEVISDDTLGKDSFEKAESEMMYTAIKGAINSANLKEEDIDYLFAGDLLNQITSSGYAARDLNIPFFGLYGACSTMSESLSMASLFIDGDFAKYVVATTSSHFSSAERQFRFPLEYGSQRAPTAQWTVTGSGAMVLSKEGDFPMVTYITTGIVKDYGEKDANNMGAAMAPAAVDTLYNHFKKLYITKMALRENKELTTSLNLKPNQMFLTTKYKVQAKYFKESELRAILQELCNLDYNFKSGKIDLQVGIETILCRYCS